MTPRRRRMVAMGSGFVCLVAATALVLSAFEQNMLYFYTPTQIEAGEAPEGTAPARRRAGRTRQRAAHAGVA